MVQRRAYTNPDQREEPREYTGLEKWSFIFLVTAVVAVLILEKFDESQGGTGLLNINFNTKAPTGFAKFSKLQQVGIAFGAVFAATAAGIMLYRLYLFIHSRFFGGKQKLSSFSGSSGGSTGSNTSAKARRFARRAKRDRDRFNKPISKRSIAVAQSVSVGAENFGSELQNESESVQPGDMPDRLSFTVKPP